MSKLKSLLFLLVIVFVSCDNENTDTDSLSLSEADIISYELVIEGVESVIDDIALYSESSFGIGETLKSSEYGKRGRSEYFKDCANIVSEELDGVITTTITFDDGCEDRHGNVISGTITKVKSISDTNKEKTVTFEGFSINGYVINGTKSFVFTSENANGNREMTGSVNLSIETEDGIITKVGTRTVEITAGGDTDTCRDDEKTITGSSEYTNVDGDIRTVVITTPLVKPTECKYIASGVKEFTRDGATTVLDYGDGTCDSIATKTAADGTVEEIELKKKRKRHH